MSSKTLNAMHGQALTDKILHHLQLIRTKPSMVIPFEEEDLPYDLLAIHLDGYLHGIGQAIGKHVVTNYQRWHQMQLRMATPAPWHMHLRYTNKEASESDLRNLLLNDIESYFKANPNWQENDNLPLRFWLDELDDAYESRTNLPDC